MALIAIHGPFRGARGRAATVLRRRHDVASTPSGRAALRLVRERPVEVLVLDACGSRPASCARLVRRIRSDFPGVGLVAIARVTDEPMNLFELGRAGVPHLVLLPVERLSRDLPRAVARARRRGTRATVLSALSPHVDRRGLRTVSIALDEVHRRLGAEELAERVGLSRPFLSECLKETSLPSVGHLLVWTRLLHAGAWLGDPGRTGESVARQLEYNDGSAFRRALRNYTEATPTEVRRGGGLSFVLSRFMEWCGFSEPGSRRRVSVA